MLSGQSFQTAPLCGTKARLFWASARPSIVRRGGASQGVAAHEDAPRTGPRTISFSMSPRWAKSLAHGGMSGPDGMLWIDAPKVEVLGEMPHEPPEVHEARWYVWGTGYQAFTGSNRHALWAPDDLPSTGRRLQQGARRVVSNARRFTLRGQACPRVDPDRHPERGAREAPCLRPRSRMGSTRPACFGGAGRFRQWPIGRNTRSS